MGGRIEIFQPNHRIGDLFGIEPYRVEFAFQMGWLWTAIASVIVFVNKDEHFKHGANIAQKFEATGRDGTSPSISALTRSSGLG